MPQGTFSTAGRSHLVPVRSMAASCHGPPAGFRGLPTFCKQPVGQATYT